MTLFSNDPDEILIQRALRAGWRWVPRQTQHPFGSKKSPSMGWMASPNHFLSATEETKADRLKKDKGGLGFEHEYDCHECGQPIYLRWLCNEEMIRDLECFGCKFWLDLIRRDREEEGRGIVVLQEEQRRHYIIGEESPKSNPSFRGFGGSKFTIRLFQGGQIITTTNLWHQGDVPERFWDRLPINAEFVR